MDLAGNNNTVNGPETEKLINTTFQSEGSPRIYFRNSHRRDSFMLREISRIESPMSVFQASRVGNVKCVLRHCQSAETLDEKDSRELTALHYAACSNHVQIINILLQYGASLDVRGINNMTPCQAAARFNCVEAVKVLLQKGADPTMTNTGGATALHFAARRGYKEITEMLLADPKTNVNHCDKSQTTALHLACICGSAPICQMLLEHGANITSQTTEGRTPLHQAARHGHENIAELLINHCDESLSSAKEYVDVRDSDNNTALHLACRKGHLSVAKLCVSHGADVNAELDCSYSSPIHLASASGVTELVTLLIENGAEIDARDVKQRTPLHWAASHNHESVIEVLLEKGADVECKDRDSLTPFLSAVRHGRTEAAKFLVKYGAKISACDESMRSCLHLVIQFQHLDTLRMLLDLPDTSLLHSMDKNMKSALHYAASSGNFEMVRLLLDKNCKVDCTDVSEKTPLHIAASHGHVACAQLLGKAAPTHVNDQDERGLTPLHIAATMGNSNVCDVLLHIGAYVQARDTNRRIALHYAAEAGKTKTVEVLLLVNNVSSELEAQDSRNETPLHLASRNGHVEVVQLLLHQGADVMSRNDKGMTSLDIAIQEGKSEVATFFVQHDRWYEQFLNQTKECPRPMQNLIEKLPEVAKTAMDRCVTYSEHDTSHNDFTTSFDFLLLDPGHDEKENASKSFFGPTTMLQYNREELLTHPLTHALLRWKWVTLGKGVYYFNLLVYIVFLIFVTMFVVASRSRVTIYFNLTQTVEEDQKLLNRRNRNSFSMSIPIIVIIFAIIQIIKELYQIYLQRLKYFTHASNLLDWCVYIWALFFMMPFAMERSVFGVRSVLWPAGAGLVLFTFANLIAFLRRFPIFGLYITMFLEVLKTALRVLLVFSLFIAGYSIAFFILFKEQKTFHTVSWSFVKTTMMMLGELDYGSTITSSLGERNSETGAPLVPAPLPSVICFYSFCILMSVLLMNLLVGLAVGDIDTIQKNATIRSIALQVEFVAVIDQRYPRWLLRKFYKPKLQLKPNMPQGILHWLMIYSLEDVALGSKRLKNTQETDNGLDKVKTQIEAQDKKMKSFQNLLLTQNKMLKLMAAKLDVKEEADLSEWASIDGALDRSLYREEILGLSTMEEQKEIPDTELHI